MGYGFMIDLFMRFMEPLFPYTFDPLFAPLLAMGGPLTGARITIILMSVVVAALLTVLRYVLIDLDRYEDLKERRKELNRKMKEARDEGKTDQIQEHTQEMKDLTMENLRMSMKPTLVSFPLFFLLLPWLFATFNPIVGLAAVDGGAYTGTLTYNGVDIPIEVQNSENPVVMVEGNSYGTGETFRMDGLPWKVKNINVEDEPEVKMAAEIVQLPFSLPLVGDELGWLGTYILASIPFTLIFQKLLGIQ